MKKFLYANEHGEIQQISSPIKSTAYPTVGWDSDRRLHIMELPYSTNDSEILDTKYFDSDTSTLLDRPAKPVNTPYYVWENRQWNFLQDKFLEHIRVERDRRLIASDWTQVTDAPLTTAQKTEWQTYRQALRDITDNLDGTETSVADINWPTKP